MLWLSFRGSSLWTLGPASPWVRHTTLVEAHGEAKLLAYLMTAEKQERGIKGLKRGKTCPSKTHYPQLGPTSS